MKKQFNSREFTSKKAHRTNKDQHKYFGGYNKTEQWKKKFDNFKDNYKSSNFNIKKQQSFNENFNKYQDFNERSFKFKQNFTTKNYKRWSDKKLSDSTRSFNAKYFIKSETQDQLNKRNRGPKLFLDKIWKEHKFNEPLIEPKKFIKNNNFNKFFLSKIKQPVNSQSSYRGVRSSFKHKFIRNINDRGRRRGGFIQFKRNNRFSNNFKSYSGKTKFPYIRKFFRRFDRQKAFRGHRFKQYQHEKKPRFLKGWRTCKKPFWKRKSLSLLNYII